MLDERLKYALPRPVPRVTWRIGDGIRWARAMGPAIPWRTVLADGRAFRGALASRWSSAAEQLLGPVSSDPDDDSIPPRRRDPLAGGLSIDLGPDLLVPREATRAIVAAAEVARDAEEASRIFDTFNSLVGPARSSPAARRRRTRPFGGRPPPGGGQRPVVRVRQVSGPPSGPGTRVLALLLERGTADSAGPGLTAALEEAVADARALSPSPAIWVDLAAAHVAVDAGDLGRAQESFAAFLGAWTGQPASLTPQVEVLRGRLGAE